MGLTGTPSLIGGNLPSSKVVSGVAALAEIPRTVAGNNRLYYELVTGQSVSSATRACSPPNSRSMVGEDHSGAGFGVALVHPYWATSYASAETTASVAAPDSAMQPPTMHNDSNATTAFDHVFAIPVPSCYPGGAYSSSTLTVLSNVVTSHASGTTTLKVYKRPADGGNWRKLGTVTISHASTGLTVDTATLALDPGVVNNLRFKLATTNTVEINVEILAMALQ
jgi:hypothetical protein